MWEKIRVIFTIPELRKRIFLTLLLLAIYRVGYQIPLPILNQAELGGSDDTGLFSSLLRQASLFSAANLRSITIFGLGIMPYISASIILQLLASVWKPLEELKKEGETGRKKINEYTRYLTVALCIMQSIFFLWQSASSSGGQGSMVHPAFIAATEAGSSGGGALYWGWFVTSILTMTAGTVFLMWVGEQIDEYGIGNGISLLIMAGILAQMPNAITGLANNMQWRLTRFDGIGIETLILLISLFVAVVFGVVFITLGKRSIPVQSAKHVRGRRVFGGNRQGLLLRINQAGVMPIIFASSLLMLPSLVFGWLASTIQGEGSWRSGLASFFNEIQLMFSRGTSFFYSLMYIGMIYFFCYFWTAITFNPKEMADNLKEYGTFIPGYRPGRRTADYLENVMTRITFVGAGFLSLVAIVPTIISSSLNIDSTIASFYGGTALLIAVSVAFDLVQKIDSHLVMRNYKGLLES
jgi:preprotein translocase subunit SecY